MQEVQLKDAFTDISCAAAETELEACRSVLGERGLVRPSLPPGEIGVAFKVNPVSRKNCLNYSLSQNLLILSILYLSFQNIPSI